MVSFHFFLIFFFFKQKTAYEMRISDWSSDVCSSDLHRLREPRRQHPPRLHLRQQRRDILAPRHRAGKNVGGSDRILDREIDPYPADRRHRVRRVTDEQHPRLVPSLEPVAAHRDALSVVPARHRIRPGPRPGETGSGSWWEGG